MEALRQPTIRVVAIIAEGVPEADTKQLIAYARQHNKVLIGPATVGGVQARAQPAGLSCHLVSASSELTECDDVAHMCCLCHPFQAL